MTYSVEVLREKLQDQLDSAGLVRISSLEYNHERGYENTDWLGCYAIKRSDYLKYGMDKLGIEGDHVPDYIEEFWEEVCIDQP